MNYLSAEKLSKHYGEKVLFENISLGLNKGDKTALVAQNGTGKSTLFRILAGREAPDSGEVTYRDGIKVSFLEQLPSPDESLSINELIASANTDVMEVIREYEDALEAQSENFNAETQQALEIATAKMDQAGAWDYDRRMKQLLTLFNITDLDQKIGRLSGGQKKRLALALTLLDDPDLLILDEPTNHLDIDMIEWLEKYLTQSGLTILMVTHDRYFLDRICNHIIEMEDGQLYHYNGNYAYFLEKKAEREEVQRVEQEKARQLMKKELEWMRRMPKARGTKAKARKSAFYETREKATSTKEEQELKLGVNMARIGGKIVELEHVTKQFDDLRILEDFNYIFKKGERIGVIGKNGVGKTTFLNLLTGHDKPDKGEIRRGQTVVFGYYTQEGIKLDEDLRMIDVVKEIAEVIDMGDGRQLSASQFLQHFMFPPKSHYKYVSQLSGGEHRRLHLLTVLIKNPNFLILDEPTNDLDILVLNRVEEFLANFPGCLILVSHDRYFLDKLTDHLFIFEGEGQVKDFVGNYTQYSNQKEQQQKTKRAEKAKARKEEGKSKPKPAKPKKGLSYKEKREYERLEKEIEELEAEKAQLEQDLNTADKPYDELSDISNRIGEIMQQIDEKTARWMELDEKGEGV